MVAEISVTSQRLGRIYMWQGTDYVARWVGGLLYPRKRTSIGVGVYVRL